MSLSDYVENKPVIEAEEIILRPMTANDVPSLYEWMPDKAIYTYWGKGPSKTEKNPELLFEKEERATKSFHLGIALKETDEVIGDIWVYLIENDRMASVAVRLSQKHQGRGLGTQALSAMTKFCFENTELQRLWAEIDIRNVPSQRIFEKCGYTREGCIRNGKMVNVWCDYYIYGILADDM